MDFLDSWLRDSCGHANTLERGRKAADFVPQHGLMILGTDTEVGKTQVAQLLLRQLVERGYRAGAYKPVASGTEPGASESDAVRLQRALGRDVPLERICPQHFLAPLAPPIAAQREGRQVDEVLLRRGAGWWRDHCEILIVEGAGGALSPLGWSATVLDVAADLGYPVVLVASLRLGMMNHVLLTLEAVRSRGLQVAALIVNETQPVERFAESAVDGPAFVDGPVGVTLDESLACLLPFCGKIACYRLDYEGSTLFPMA